MLSSNNLLIVNNYFKGLLALDTSVSLFASLTISLKAPLKQIFSKPIEYPEIKLDETALPCSLIIGDAIQDLSLIHI